MINIQKNYTCVNICGMRVEQELFEEKRGLVRKGEQEWGDGGIVGR